MNDPLERFWRTGRTSRMLEEARVAARSGCAVYVLASSQREADQLRRQFGERDAEQLGVKFEATNTPGNFDWNSLTLRGAQPNCRIFVDPHAIESRFGHLLRAYHAYDDVPRDPGSRLPVFKVGAAGLAYSGKDSFAKVLACALADKTNLSVAVIAFADPLKQMAREMGWDGKKDEKGRRFLQTLGQLGREYDEDFWVKQWEKNCAEFSERAEGSQAIVIASDVRHDNERDRMDVCFFVECKEDLRAKRAEAVGECLPPSHVSEQYVPRPDDIKVENESSVDELAAEAERQAQMLADRRFTDGDKASGHCSYKSGKTG